MLCDHIIFWERHRQLPTFTAEELDKFLDTLDEIYRKTIHRISVNATARLVAGLRAKT